MAGGNNNEVKSFKLTKFGGFTSKPLFSAINFGRENQVAVLHGARVLNVVLPKRMDSGSLLVN